MTPDGCADAVVWTDRQCPTRSRPCSTAHCGRTHPPNRPAGLILQIDSLRQKSPVVHRSISRTCGTLEYLPRIQTEGIPRDPARLKSSPQPQFHSPDRRRPQLSISLSTTEAPRANAEDIREGSFESRTRDSFRSPQPRDALASRPWCHLDEVRRSTSVRNQLAKRGSTYLGPLRVPFPFAIPV
jgi:hypothetical protein